MCLVENAQHKKIFAYIQQRVCANKAARQLFCSSLLFCFRELNRFLEISVRDPRKILRVSQNSKLDPQNLVLEPQKSKLDSQKLQGSRIKFRVETVNLHLSGTVHVTEDAFNKNLPGLSLSFESPVALFSSTPALLSVRFEVAVSLLLEKYS